MNPRKKDKKETVSKQLGDFLDVGSVDTGGHVGRTVFGKPKFYFVLLGLGLCVLGFLGYKFLVIGWVDRSPLTRFELFSAMEKRYGKEAFEQLVSEKLILGEARNRRVSVNPSEVAEEIKKIETQQGGPEKLDQVLKAQGLTVEELKRQLSLQILIKKMFGENIQVSDEEVNKYIEENKQFLVSGKEEDKSSSVSAKLKEDTKEQLKQQKMAEGFNKWLKEARDSKRVSKV